MLELPTSAKQVKSRIKADIRSALPISNPFTAGSWLGTLSDALGERIYSFYYAITQLISELFPDTTTMYVKRWAAIFDLSQKGSTGSTGSWNYTGVLSPLNPSLNIVPNATILVDSLGNTYETTQETLLSSATLISTTWTRTATQFTVYRVDHNLPTGALVTCAAASNALLNGVHVITAVNADYFSIDLIASGTTSGTVLVSYTSQTTTIRALTPGASTNLAPLTVLTLQSSINTITSLGMVDYSGLTGGVDTETLPNLRSRLLLRLKNPVANFNKAQIESLVLQQSGITRVFVKTITPAVGQVTIYPLVDGSNPPIPSVTRLQEIKDVIVSTIMPADMSAADLFVSPAAQLAVPITITALNPNTIPMQNSITAGLEQLFETQAGVGITLTIDDIRSAINSSFDINTKLSVTSFSMTVPSASTVPAANQLPILGTVIYPAV